MNLDNTFLDQQRLAADTDADKLVKEIFHLGKQHELYAGLSLSETEINKLKDDSGVNQFLLAKRKLPNWFSEERLLDGQNLFAEYAVEIMTLLGVYALPYCYAGSPGNKALYLSEKMRNSPGKRLADTAEFIINVSTPGNLTSSKVGHFYINKTRLIHAIARYYLTKSNWNVDWGVPINQEDMAGTNLAFSFIILNGLRLTGFSLTDKQKEDFIYLWRYIGYQMHIHEELLPDSYMEAFRLKQKIVDRNFKKSSEGVALTSELLNYYRSMVPGNKSVFIESQVRFYLGPNISSYLGLQKEPVKDGITELVNSLSEVQNYFALHKSSYGNMLAQHQTMKSQLNKS